MAGGAVAQTLLLSVSVVSNIVRHDESLLPLTTPGIPKVAFLTVQTLFVEALYLGLSASEAWLGGPEWLTVVCHSFDALVVALGAVLWLSYYALVHSEASFRATKQRNWLLWNHVVHFPTLFLPILSASVKDPTDLARHALSTTATATLALAYAIAYACCISRCDTPPYAFMRHLTTTRARLCFWGTGIVAGVLPITLLTSHFVSSLKNGSSSFSSSTIRRILRR